MPPLFSQSQAIAEPYHPVVQFKLGTDPDIGDFLVTVPPDHLIEFTAISKKGADEAIFSFIDHTFGRLEAEIFRMDQESKPLLYRWGFPSQGLEETMWQKMFIRTFQPSLSHAGVRIRLTGVAMGGEFAMLVEPTTYIGKISSVVKQIAEEMNFETKNIYIEDTNDDDNEVKNTEWFAGNLTRMDILHKLAGVAKSKANPNDNFYFKLSGDGSFHFHTGSYSKDNLNKHKKTQKPTYRLFKVLFGQPTGVVQFTPRYQPAQTMGAFANKTIAGTLDPRSKQFQERILTRQKLGLTSKKADPSKGGKTTSGDLTKSKDPLEQKKKANAYTYEPSKQVAVGGRCAGKTRAPYTSSDQALTKIENAYKQMQQYIAGGTLELVGTPENVDFLQDEKFIDIHVVLPASAAEFSLQPGKYTGLHWSSGRYRIDKVTHTITSGYYITVELHRMWHGVGTEKAKTGPPAQAQKTDIKVT